MAQPPHGPLRSFGRVRGRPIRPGRETLVQTLLPKIAVPDPTAGPVDPDALMPGARAIWLEVGFGGGEHLAAQAAASPDVLLLGAEPFLNGAASALGHIAAQGLGNVRLHVGDARDLLDALPEASLARLFILFPDPWPKARHHKRRLIQPAFLDAAARALRPGAGLRFATDWADYLDWTLAAFQRDRRFVWTAERADDWRRPPADHVATRYEAKRLGDIAPVFLDYVRV